MILIDANVLIHAFRVDSDDHPRCRTWLESVFSGSEPVGIAPLVLSSVVRICTNKRAFARPSTLEETVRYCEALLAQPNVISIVPGPRHWPIFTRLCRETNAQGNLVPDAYLAALAIENDAEWISEDRDFARFPGLRWRRPLA